jgi:uncharacterized membrane protein YeaQ/YmgE (transglycosylase-associated protein family)
MDIVYFLILGAVAGFIAGLLTKGHGFGLVGNILVGIAGAVIGGFVIRLFGFYHSGALLPSLITAVFGAIVLLALLQFLANKR